jgi:hypothetical protein
MAPHLLDDIKQHPAIAIIFLGAGFLIGLGAFRYGAGFFNAAVVLRDSYIYKSEVETTHVPIQRFAAVSDELKGLRSENESLRREVEQLRASQSAMSTSVCQRFAQEANTLASEQQRTESNVQYLLSPYAAYSKKTEDQLNADRMRVGELRKYSEQLNQQLIQVRAEVSRCNR